MPARLILVLLLVLWMPRHELRAQQQPGASPSSPPRAGTGKIAGLVLDSLRGRFLSGADVVVEGFAGILPTDSVGKFAVANLPPGTYRVAVFHPLLDTLGISLMTPPFRVGADSISVAVLSVPSARTIAQRDCRIWFANQENSVVLGRVRDPETLKPIGGADVSIAWVEIDATKGKALRSQPRLVRSTTDSAGTFHICGLPNPMAATLKAKKGSLETAEIPIDLGNADPEVVARTLFLSASPDSRTGNASVSGRVLLEGGQGRPGAGTRVEIVGTERVAVTNERGDFSLTNLPSGTRVLVARRVGFAAAAVPVDLTTREAKQVTITLPRFVAMMDPVVVNARRTVGLERVGFNERRRQGMGAYVGPAELAKIHPIYLTDIFRRLPGLRVGTSGVAGARGGGCVYYYVDDMPWLSTSPDDVNQFVNGEDVVAVEVYQGPIAPARYTRGNSDCTTVLIWTQMKIRDVNGR